MNPCAAAVLVGGAGSRMGGPAGQVFHKPLLGFRPDVVHGSDVLLDHVVARVKPQVRAVCLCAHDNVPFWTRFGLPVVVDGENTERQGPLAGMVAGLAWAESQNLASVLIVPGDTPFLPRDLLHALGEAPAVAEAGGRVHHLVCHLSVMSRPILAAALARGHSRVGEALQALGARRVAFEDATEFLNINTPQDYAQARARLKE